MRVVPKSLLVWIVAFTSTGESSLQAVEAFMDDERAKVILWLTGAVVIFLLASVVERVKGSPGE